MAASTASARRAHRGAGGVEGGVESGLLRRPAPQCGRPGRGAVRAAAAVAVPISLALTATLVALRKRTYRTWPDVTATLTTFNGGDLWLLLPVPVTWLALVLAVLCRRHGRRAPRFGTSAALIGLTAEFSSCPTLCRPGSPGAATLAALAWPRGH